jgi:hypothetical protein
MREFLLWGGWYVLTGIASAIGLFACILFVVRYQIETGGAWWRHADGRSNPFGRFLFFRKVLLSCLFALALTNRIFPGWTGQTFVTSIVFVAFAIQTFVPYRLLLQAQKDIDVEEARR